MAATESDNPSAPPPEPPPRPEELGADGATDAQLDAIASEAVEQDLAGRAEPPAAPEQEISQAEAAAKLRDLDSELARQAESTIQADGLEGDFELEGDFLSQDEVARIMNQEAGQLAAAAPAVADQLPAAPPAAEAPADVLPEPAAAAAAPPEPETPPRVTAEAPQEAPVEHVSADSPPADESADLAAPREKASEPSSAPPPPEAEALLDDHAEAEQLLAETEAAAAPPARWRPRLPGPIPWKRWVVAAAAAGDWPFRWVPARAKGLIGLAGAITCLMAVAVWILAFILA